MKIAVVGHVEWGRFMRVPYVPKAGEIVHASESWEEVAGGGGVAAMQVAALNHHCTFFTSVGDDENGRRAVRQLQQAGVEVYATTEEDKATRTIEVAIDADNERTITVLGDLKPLGKNQNLPWEKLAEMDAVYFVSGDALALQFARRAKVLISTARIASLLHDSGILVDVLLMSANDSGERYKAGDILPEPRLLVTTCGDEGGFTSSGIKYQAEEVGLGEVIDSYGCGDSFAAGLTYGLAKNLSIEDVLKVAAQSGSAAVRRRGAFGN